MFHGNAGLDDTESRPVAHEPRRDRREFHENVATTARQIRLKHKMAGFCGTLFCSKVARPA